MTIEKAVELMELYTAPGRRYLYTTEFVEAHEMAITALRAQQNTEKNDPLTAEEIDVCRKSHVPIWAVVTGAKGIPCGWALTGTRAAAKQDFCNTTLWYDIYGAEWIAYRRPPTMPIDSSS